MGGRCLADLWIIEIRCCCLKLENFVFVSIFLQLQIIFGKLYHSQVRYTYNDCKIHHMWILKLRNSVGITRFCYIVTSHVIPQRTSCHATTHATSCHDARNNARHATTHVMSCHNARHVMPQHTSCHAITVVTSCHNASCVMSQRPSRLATTVATWLVMSCHNARHVLPRQSSCCTATHVPSQHNACHVMPQQLLVTSRHNIFICCRDTNPKKNVTARRNA